MAILRSINQAIWKQFFLGRVNYIHDIDIIIFITSH